MIKKGLFIIFLLVIGGTSLLAFPLPRSKNRRGLKHTFLIKADYFPASDLANLLEYHSEELAGTISISSPFGMEFEFSSMVGQHFELATGFGYYRQTATASATIFSGIAERIEGKGTFETIPLTFTIKLLPLGRKREYLLIPYLGGGIGGYLGLIKVEASSTTSNIKLSLGTYTGELAWHLTGGIEFAFSKRFGVLAEVKGIFPFFFIAPEVEEIEEMEALKFKGFLISFGLAYHF
ncbi:MAG: hypothetical protein J7L64_03270 [Acidobacteria bacterium]|nr:hypothetical protein [Acidobacteriota bacterium]